jgi:hypothetical protein
MQPYRAYFPNAGLLLPVTERLADRVLVLPTGTALGPDDLRQICDTLRFAVLHSKEISERLKELTLNLTNNSLHHLLGV